MFYTWLGLLGDHRHWEKLSNFSGDKHFVRNATLFTHPHPHNHMIIHSDAQSLFNVEMRSFLKFRSHVLSWWLTSLTNAIRCTVELLVSQVTNASLHSLENSDVVQVKLSHSDTLIVQSLSHLYTTSENTKLIFGTAIADMNSIPHRSNPGGTAMKVSAFVADSQRPSITYFHFNMDVGHMYLKFTETIDVTSFNATGIILLDSQVHCLHKNCFTLGRCCCQRLVLFSWGNISHHAPRTMSMLYQTVFHAQVHCNLVMLKELLDLLDLQTFKTA